MKKIIITIVLLPYIILEGICVIIFGRGFGAYQYHNSLLEIYQSMGLETYVKFIANLESDSGRCKRFYGVARTSYLNRRQEKRYQGRFGNRF